MKRIFEIESASGVRVDRDIVLAQLNSAAFDGCFSVKDITDDLEKSALERMTKTAKDITEKGVSYSRMTFDGDYHLECVDAETVTLTRLPEAPYSQPPKASEISEAWDVFMEKASAEMAVMGDALDSKMRSLGRALLYRLKHPE